MEPNSNFCSVKDLTLITGLTDRTIRSYISSGILRGEKICGAWRFTRDQVEEFVSHPAVRPSILAKNNAAVYDFLLGSGKSAPEACIILDLPGCDRETTAEYFCRRISSEEFQNISFSFDGIPSAPRVILRGAAEDVLQLAGGYMASANR